MTSTFTKRLLLAFGLEGLLLVAILLSLDRFPPWTLKTTAIIAVSLPVICYLAIATKPEVYRAWMRVLREVCLGIMRLSQWLWSCFSIRNAVDLLHRVRGMKACPTSVDDWFAFLFFPFKAYVLLAFPFLWICHALGPLNSASFPRLSSFAASTPIFSGYALCLPVLLIGALLQALFSKRGRSTQTVLVFLLGLLIFWAIPRELAGR